MTYLTNFKGENKLKKVLSLLLAVAIFSTMSVYAVTDNNTNVSLQDIRAVWITTVFNTDFPSVKGNITAQKNEFINKLNMLQAVGINTVVVQVRPKADALYKSSINPWSDVLTGTQGKDPGYDPMAFMIAETHKRGMKFHAWLNPYRVTTSGTNLNALSKNHPARLHPDWVMKYNNALCYKPYLQAVKNHIVATVKEIVSKYNVDGIDFDDYFYPSNYPLPKGEKKDGKVANSRRQDVNDMVAKVNSIIKTTKKNVSFGISPVGIWKNNSSDITGSNTRGNESYYAVFADTRTWIKNKLIDYVVPQIYWETGNKAADYETLVKWWSNEVRGTNVKLYIGQGIYRASVAKQIDVQLKINQKYPEVKGSFYYGTGNLLSDVAGCKEKIEAFNKAVLVNTDTINPVVPSGTSSQSSTKIGTIIASELNIRSGSGLQYSIVSKLVKGVKVTILNSKAGWYNIKLPNGKTGWAKSEYIYIKN